MSKDDHIIALYEEVTSELRRLRADQWRLAYYFIAEAIGAIYLVGDGTVEQFVNVYVLIIAFGVQVACIVFYIHYLHVNQRYIGVQRAVRNRIERLLGLDEVTLPNGEKLMPESWGQATWITFAEYNTVVVPLGLFVVILQGFSIYVVVARLVPLVC